MVTQTIQTYGAALQEQRRMLQAQQAQAQKSELSFSRQQLMTSTPIQRQAVAPIFAQAKEKVLETIKGELEKQKQLEKEFEPLQKEYELQKEQQRQFERIERERSERMSKPTEKVLKQAVVTPSLSPENLEAIKKSVEKMGYLAPEMKSVLEKAGYEIKMGESKPTEIPRVDIEAQSYQNLLTKATTDPKLAEFLRSYNWNVIDVPKEITPKIQSLVEKYVSKIPSIIGSPFGIGPPKLTTKEIVAITPYIGVPSLDLTGIITRKYEPSQVTSTISLVAPTTKKVIDITRTKAPTDIKYLMELGKKELELEVAGLKTISPILPYLGPPSVSIQQLKTISPYVMDYYKDIGKRTVELGKKQLELEVKGLKTISPILPYLGPPKLTTKEISIISPILPYLGPPKLTTKEISIISPILPYLGPPKLVGPKEIVRGVETGIGIVTPIVKKQIGIEKEKLISDIEKTRKEISMVVPYVAPIAKTYLKSPFFYKPIVGAKELELSTAIVGAGLGIGISKAKGFFEARERFFKPLKLPISEEVITGISRKEKYGEDWVEVYKEREELYQQEAKGRIISDLKTGIANALDYETQQNLIQQLYEKYGIVTVSNYNPKTKQSYLVFENEPSWYKKLKPSFETKLEKETFIPFVIRKYSGETGKVTGEWFQRTFYKGTKGVESEQLRIGPSAQEFGEIAKFVSTIPFYSIPYIKGIAFVGGPTEALTRGPSAFIRYTKENPWEVAMAGAYGTVKGYQLYRSFQPTVYGKGTLFMPEVQKKEWLKTNKGYISKGEQFYVTSPIREQFGFKEIYRGGIKEFRTLEKTQPYLYEKIIGEMTMKRPWYSPLRYIGGGEGPGMSIEESTKLLKTKTYPKLIGITYKKIPLVFRGQTLMDTKEAIGTYEVFGGIQKPTKAIKLTRQFETFKHIPSVTTFKKDLLFYPTRESIPRGLKGIPALSTKPIFEERLVVSLGKTRFAKEVPQIFDIKGTGGTTMTLPKKMIIPSKYESVSYQLSKTYLGGKPFYYKGEYMGITGGKPLNIIEGFQRYEPTTKQFYTSFATQLRTTKEGYLKVGWQSAVSKITKQSKEFGKLISPLGEQVGFQEKQVRLVETIYNKPTIKYYGLDKAGAQRFYQTLTGKPEGIKMIGGKFLSTEDIASKYTTKLIDIKPGQFRFGFATNIKTDMSGLYFEGKKLPSGGGTFEWLTTPEIQKKIPITKEITKIKDIRPVISGHKGLELWNKEFGVKGINSIRESILTGTITPVKVGPLITAPKVTTTSIVSTGASTILSDILAPSAKLIEITRTTVSPKIETALIPKVITIQPTIEIQKPIQIPIQVPTQVSIQVPTQQEVPKLIEVPKQVTPTIPTTPTTTTIPRITTTPRIPPPLPPIIPPPTSEKKLKEIIPKKFKKTTLVIPYGRRYGKFKPIGRPTTLEMARKRGIQFLKSTLGATIEVRKPTGERIPIAQGLGKEFRPGKKGKDIFQVIQKAPFRLGTRAERIEILAARRRIKI